MVEEGINHFRLELEAAKVALERAKEDDLKRLSDNYDRKYISIVQKYEQEYRKAQNENGLAFTAVLREVEAREATITWRRERAITAARTEYEQTCERAGCKDDPSCAPYFDALACVTLEADRQRAQQMNESRGQYKEERDRLNASLAQRLEALRLTRDQAIEFARAAYEQEAAAIRVPLEEAVALAQAAFDRAVEEAADLQYAQRQERLSILNMYQKGRISENEAVNALELL